MDLFLRKADGDGGQREVEARVERIGPGRYRVELANLEVSETGEQTTGEHRSWEVDAASVGDRLASLRLGRTGDSAAVRPHFEVSTRETAGRSGTVSTGTGSTYRVVTRHHTTDVEVMSPLEHLSREALGGDGARGPERVTAYMPGRVVAVLVEEGAEVAAGQGIVVLEAMKMENEIKAEHAGTVRQLLVEPGQSVEAGEGLFELE